MTDVQISGSVSAMAFAAGAAAVIASYSLNLSDQMRFLLIATGLVLAFVAWLIERMHTKKDLEIERIKRKPHVPKSNTKTRRRRVP